MPSCSNSPHGPPTLPATSVVQLSSIAFFCTADIWSYLSRLHTNANVVTQTGTSIWTLATLSMPKSCTEPPGQLTESPTTFPVRKCPPCPLHRTEMPPSCLQQV